MNKRKISLILILTVVVLSYASSALAAPVNINRLLRLGSRGADVAMVQNRLNQLGYNCGKADGIFGRSTYNAVVAFQRANRLGADGIVGRNTLDRLFDGQANVPSQSGGNNNPDSSTSNVLITSLLRMGSRGPEVVILQNRLNQLGYDCGKADGIFGQGTHNAVMAFQRTNGLSADGIVGKNTAEKLFSSSSIPSRGDEIPNPNPSPEPAPNPQPTQPDDGFTPFRGVPGALKGKVVILDPGHGGRDSGATSNGFKEKDFTLDMALRLERMLKEAGATVLMTRNSDVTAELYYRGAFVNNYILEQEIAYLEKKIQNNQNAQNSQAQLNELKQLKEQKEIEIDNIRDRIIYLDDQIKESKFKLEQLDGVENEQKDQLKQEISAFDKEIDLKLPLVLSLSNEIDDLKNQISRLENNISGDDIARLADLKAKQARVKETLAKPSYKGRSGIYTGSSINTTANKDLAEIFDLTAEKYQSNIVFLSIHCNSTGDAVQTGASGVRVYHRPNAQSNYYKNYNDQKRRYFSQRLIESINETTNFAKKSGYLYTADFAVLREQNLPSALVEVGFINNPNDLDLLNKAQTREDVAQGLYKGIVSYFN